MEERINRPFKYCVVGNIVKERIDEDGNIRHGTIEFSGGTKVYICGKLEYDDPEYVDVIALSRMKTCGWRQYRVVKLNKKYIENVRASKTYNARIMDMMDDRFMGGYYAWFWWHDDPEDRKETIEYARKWNEKNNKVKDQ